MFGLLYGFWEAMFARPNVNILIIGLDHAGKSTLLEKVASDTPRHHTMLCLVPPTPPSSNNTPAPPAAHVHIHVHATLLHIHATLS